MVIFQASAEKEKLKLTRAERETISLLNKGDINKVSLSGDIITKSVIEQADINAIAKVAERRGGVFNLPHYDDISKERMKAITKSYEELSKKKFEDTEKVAQSVATQDTTKKAAASHEEKPATEISNLLVKPRDSAALGATYDYLQKAGPSVSQSDYLLSHPEFISNPRISQHLIFEDMVNYLFKTKYEMLKATDKEAAETLRRNYLDLMTGKSVKKA